MSSVNLGMPGAPSSFHVLAKPTGAICNLDCTYCFYLEKEELYAGSEFRMGDDVLRQYLSQLLGPYSGPEVTVSWQGGEPTLMGVDFFRRVVALVEELRRPRQRVEHTIQTNATLIDDEWAAFLAEADVLVGVSVDGPREVHDAYRVDKGGKSTFDRVMRGLERLRAHGVRWNALTTVNRANESRGLEVYRFLRDEAGADFMQFIPIVERDDDVVSAVSVTPDGYGRFLIEVFDEWVRRDVGDVFVQMFESTLASFVGVPGSLCVHSETCGTSVALEHTGDVYSCDHFVSPEHLLGNVRSAQLVDLVVSPQQRAFGLAKRDGLPAQCRSCSVRFACHGGCPKDRFTPSVDGEDGLNYLCPSFLAYFGHVDLPMRHMAASLRAGGDVGRVMRWVATQDS